MLESSLYPLLALKIIGTICPCFVKEEDNSASKAAWALSSVPIRWHRKLRGDSSSSNNNGRVGGFLSSMLNSSGGGGSGGDTYEPLDSSTLSVVDSPSGPCLVASPPSSSITSSSIKKKRIPLKIIKTVKSHRHVKARKGGRSRSGIEILDNTGRELIIFDVLQPRSYNINEEEKEEEEDVEDADEATRDEIIDQLEILIEWERRRQSIILTHGEDAPDIEEETVDEYDDYNDDDDDIGTPTTRTKRKGVLAEKAASIKHFAQREIEMQLYQSYTVV